MDYQRKIELERSVRIIFNQMNLPKPFYINLSGMSNGIDWKYRQDKGLYYNRQLNVDRNSISVRNPFFIL